MNSKGIVPFSVSLHRESDFTCACPTTSVLEAIYAEEHRAWGGVVEGGSR